MRRKRSHRLHCSDLPSPGSFSKHRLRAFVQGSYLFLSMPRHGNSYYQEASMAGSTMTKATEDPQEGYQTPLPQVSRSRARVGGSSQPSGESSLTVFPTFQQKIANQQRALALQPLGHPSASKKGSHSCDPSRWSPAPGGEVPSLLMAAAVQKEWGRLPSEAPTANLECPEIPFPTTTCLRKHVRSRGKPAPYLYFQAWSPKSCAR